VSPYEVRGSYGLGRHQGVAILTVDYSFDERGASPLGSLIQFPDLPLDMEAAMLAREGAEGGAHDHARFALCEPPKMAFDRPLANHGRTLSRAPEHAANRRGEIVHRDVRPGKPEEAAAAKALTTCIDRITNGYCDSVCGNCSYVLPKAAIMDSRTDDWSRSESAVSGGGSCDEGGYYGGPGQVSLPTFTGALLPNPYTHCAHLGCSHRDEAPSLKTAVATAEDAPVTGRFGHNSNTDAEAEARAFRACVGGSDGTAEACAACGTASAQDRQDPCTARTNTAESFWAQTASSSLGGTRIDDAFPVITESTAGEPLPPPVCAWGKFPVHGM
jgi:hypothetical protein